MRHIRSQGMSEGAHETLNSSASLLTGQLLLQYVPDPASDRYWPSYTNTTCPAPGAEPAEIRQAQQRLQFERDEIITAIRPLADADASGFVTTEEARAIRHLVEFWYLAAQLQRDGRDSIASLAAASGAATEAVNADLRRCESMRAKLAAAGAKMLPPEVGRFR